jgi:hypothetical protein
MAWFGAPGAGAARTDVSPTGAGAGVPARPSFSSARLVIGITAGRGRSSRCAGGASEPEHRVQELRSGVLTTPQRGQIMFRQGTRQTARRVL